MRSGNTTDTKLAHLRPAATSPKSHGDLEAFVSGRRWPKFGGVHLNRRLGGLGVLGGDQKY